jgi:hypothetical protein
MADEAPYLLECAVAVCGWLDICGGIRGEADMTFTRQTDTQSQIRFWPSCRNNEGRSERSPQPQAKKKTRIGFRHGIARL